MGKLPSMLLAVVGFALFTLARESAGESSIGATPFELAAEHAGLAVQATTVTVIHEHLQCTLDCLEGSSGQDFNRWQATVAPGEERSTCCRRTR